MDCGVVKWLGCESVSLTPKCKVVEQGRCIQKGGRVGDIDRQRSGAGCETAGGVEVEVGKGGGALLLDFTADQWRRREGDGRRGCRVAVRRRDLGHAGLLVTRGGVERGHLVACEKGIVL